MKKLFLLFALLFCFSAISQSRSAAPKGMVLIEHNEQDALQAHAERMAALKTDGYRQVYSAGKETPVDHIQTNHPVIDKHLYQFIDGAKHYYVDYSKKIKKLQRVVYIDADPYFLGEVSKDGTTIYLNSLLLQYENLNWVVFHTQMGDLFGLKRSKKGHGFTSRHWEIDQKHEDIAKQRRSRGKGSDRDEFFKQLHKKSGLDIRI